MGERVTAPAPTSKHRPWESAQAKSYSGQGVVGSPTSLAEIFDTAFSSTVDHTPHGSDCRTGECGGDWWLLWSCAEYMPCRIWGFHSSVVEISDLLLSAWVKEWEKNLLEFLTLKMKTVCVWTLTQWRCVTDLHLPSVFSKSFYKHARAFGTMSVYLSLTVQLINSTQQSFLRS